MSGYDLNVGCLSCGQILVIPAHDLRAAFTCPRCGNIQAASALVQPSTPLRAMPVFAPEQPAFGHGPNGVQAPRGVGTSNEPSASRRAWSLATWLATALGDAAWWLDRTTYGRQLPVVCVLGSIVWGSQHFATGAYPWALFAYCGLLYFLLLARLWWIREDDGSWTWRRFSERTFGAAAAALNGLLHREEFSLRALLEDLQLVLVATGLALVVLAPPLGALTRFFLSGSGELRAGFLDLLETVQTIGQGLFGAGALSWLAQWLRRRSAKTVAFKNAARSLARPGVATELPFVLDVRDPTASYDALPAELRTLAVTLSAWRPREQEREAGYERSLVRFLKKSLPGVDARTQQPFEAEDGSRGRIDVVVDDVLAIELKRALRASSEADRAVGQVFKYAASWRKGPVILLLCEAPWDFAEQPLVRRLGELHAIGRAVFVVAAGRAS